jgi:hypothetical protein
MPKLRSHVFQEPDPRGDRHLLRVAERLPPRLELIGVFDLP